MTQGACTFSRAARPSTLDRDGGCLTEFVPLI